jgi:hypothetical protein
VQKKAAFVSKGLLKNVNYSRAAPIFIFYFYLPRLAEEGAIFVTAPAYSAHTRRYLKLNDTEPGTW